MVEYLIPGEMPDAVRLHFTQTGVESRQRTVRVPAEITGYTVPEGEVHCYAFHEGALLNEGFIARNTHQTDRNGLMVVWDGVPDRVYRVSYNGSTRVTQALERLAQEFKRNIFALDARHCFSGEYYDDCQPHTEAEFGRNQDDSVCIHFNCAGRGNRRGRDDLVQLYEYPLTSDTGLARKVRKNPLNQAGGVLIADTNGQSVAEVDGGVIYILVNIEASEDRWDDYRDRTSYWGRNAQVLETILREAIPAAILQQEQLKLDPVAAQRARLAVRQEEAIGQFMAHTTPGIQERINNTQALIGQQENQARDSLQRYLAAQAEAERLQGELRLLMENPHAQDETLRQQLVNILAMPHVVGISFDGRSLEVYTDTMYIDWKQRRYKIGAFKMVIDFTRGVRLFNYTDAIRNIGQHPHVLNHEGTACFGNISEAVVRMLGAREIEMLVTILIEFLQSYNPQYPAASINPWPSVGRTERSAT